MPSTRQWKLKTGSFAHWLPASQLSALSSNVTSWVKPSLTLPQAVPGLGLPAFGMVPVTDLIPPSIVTVHLQVCLTGLGSGTVGGPFQ